jgi:hypothetical protein
MDLKKMILTADAKFEDKFDSLSKISLNMLIFGQFFLLLILAADLYYAVRISADPRVLVTVLHSVHVLFENAASGVFLLWITAIFIDYIEKKNSRQ